MTSKALYAVVAFAAIAAGAARADDITIDNTPFQSVRSRAEVQAELGQFKTSGVNPWSISYRQPAPQSATTRADVQAEYIAQRDQVAAMNGEDSGSAYLSQLTTVPHNRSATLAANGQ